MHDPRINTLAAMAIVFLFGLGGLVLIQQAITHVDWSYATAQDMTLLGN